MEENEIDILQLKFEGNGINPKVVKPSEIAELITQFEGALLATIKSDYPEINTEYVLFTFSEIRNESLGLNFEAVKEKLLASVKTAVIASYTILTTSISTYNFSKLPNEAIENLRGISKFSTKYQCNAYFKRNGEIVSTITPNTEISLNKIGIIKGDINIYGEIVDVGSNIHLKLDDGYLVYVKTDKATSKILGNRLWEQVGFYGAAKWEAVSSKIIEFKLSKILDYNPTSVVDAFAELREITSGAWDNFNNNDDINKQLLRD